MPAGLVYERTARPRQMVPWEVVCSRAGVGATHEDGKFIAGTWSFRPRLIGQAVGPLTRRGIARMGPAKPS
jgi:hypothetical protein